MLEKSISASILIGLILLIRRMGLYRLPKGTFIALWWTALFKLLLPVSLPTQLSIYNLGAVARRMTTVENKIAGKASSAAEHGMKTLIHTGTENAVHSEAVQWLEIVWLIGAVIAAGYFLVCYCKYRYVFRFAVPFCHETSERYRREHRLVRRVILKTSDRIHSPLTYGLFRPVILLPTEAEAYTSDQLIFVLEHEYRHIRRLDCLTKAVLIAAVSVYWFLPTVWIMYITANRDIELCCDEQVLRGREELRKGYAMSLIALSERKSRLNCAFIGFCENATEERIRAVMKTKKHSHFLRFAAVLLVVCIFCGFATTMANAEDRELNAVSVTETLPQDNGEAAAETETMNISENSLLIEELSFYEANIPELISSGCVTNEIAIANFESLKALVNGGEPEWGNREPLVQNVEEDLYALFLNDGSGKYYYHFTVNLQSD